LFFCCGRADVGISDPAVLEERCSSIVDVIGTEISDHADCRRICLPDFLCSSWELLDFSLYFLFCVYILLQNFNKNRIMNFELASLTN